ncbi:1,4-alpha-glucan branching protein [Streptomyces sp. CC77]|uniref:maltokinase N-terminal cap-like domain-containing protein n=1 Tax=Streptomyces sp. CC77 TaxID=1906739 RepID=UPI0008DD869D|nr:1,4-alpha-glucan branching protein [Streptomyces sp. CC77]OII61537.1 1,4-alpha-glucan branching protein [Streptomyces sp. CC77]
MAIIHKTTLTPTKLELVQAWLPQQPWYAGTGAPALEKAGGFRLDDPEGEVGIEFMVVADTSGDAPVAYHVPLTYRGAPLDGAGGEALVGTAEHGVLGKRWVYDGVRDPLLVDQVRELLRGRAVPQAQSLTDTPAPTVEPWLDETLARDGGDLDLDFVRVLREGPAEGRGGVVAGWGEASRGLFVRLRDAR